MRTGYAASLTCNALLLAVAFGLVLGLRRDKTHSAGASDHTLGPQFGESVPSKSVSIADPQNKPFRWSQLESSDYRVYVSNLRSIGCPEQTVRDIITADVDTLYAKRREELCALFSDRSIPSDSAARRTDLVAQLRRLQDEESSVISALLGSAPGGQRIEKDQPLAATAESVVIPLALRNSQSVELEPEQKQILQQLRENFIAEIGGPNQDPADPGYLDRWQKAQPESDARVRGALGVRAFLNLQVASGSAD
jgi:hypothetical protein